MQFPRFFRFAIGVSLLSGCMAQEPSYFGAGTGGAILGASTGAIVGALIKNGDIAKSAGFGAAVGVPVGLALVALMKATEEPDPATIDRSAEIEANHSKIFQQEREIEELRAAIQSETPRFQTATEPGTRVYNGQSLQNPFR